MSRRSPLPIPPSPASPCPVRPVPCPSLRPTPPRCYLTPHRPALLVAAPHPRLAHSPIPLRRRALPVVAHARCPTTKAGWGDEGLGGMGYDDQGKAMGPGEARAASPWRRLIERRMIVFFFPKNRSRLSNLIRWPRFPAVAPRILNHIYIYI